MRRIEAELDPLGYAKLSRTLNHWNVRPTCLAGSKEKGSPSLYFIHASFHPLVTTGGCLPAPLAAAIIPRNCFFSDLSRNTVAAMYFSHFNYPLLLPLLPCQIFLPTYVLFFVFHQNKRRLVLQVWFFINSACALFVQTLVSSRIFKWHANILVFF